jgi:hypothetical protein
MKEGTDMALTRATDPSYRERLKKTPLEGIKRGCATW